MCICVYDFEVFSHDWLVVIYDMADKEKKIIHNSEYDLACFYDEHKNDIWVGYTNINYDQYILTAILLGMNPKTVNDQIIIDGLKGWQISKEFSKIQMYNYDTVGTQRIGLKTLEGFMGNDIKETDVPFDLDRPLTDDEIAETVKYCTHDVE